VFPGQEAWVPLKQYIENSCHQSNQCNDGVGDWNSTVNAMDAHVQKIKKKAATK
jgi:hypothetical protein